MTPTEIAVYRVAAVAFTAACVGFALLVKSSGYPAWRRVRAIMAIFALIVLAMALVACGGDATTTAATYPVCSAATVAPCIVPTAGPARPTIDATSAYATGAAKEAARGLATRTPGPVQP